MVYNYVASTFVAPKNTTILGIKNLRKMMPTRSESDFRDMPGSNRWSNSAQDMPLALYGVLRTWNRQIPSFTVETGTLLSGITDFHLVFSPFVVSLVPDHSGALCVADVESGSMDPWMLDRTFFWVFCIGWNSIRRDGQL